MDKVVYTTETRCPNCNSTNLRVVGTSNINCEDCDHWFIVLGARFKGLIK